MTIVWIALTLLLLAAWLGWLTALVRGDGLGHREPPRSHHAWDDPVPREQTPPHTHVAAR